MFLGSADIQLGVNESLYDTSRVVSSMVDGIMARVGHHSEVEVRSLPTLSCAGFNLFLQTLAANSSVPVINALSHLYHPTQILADIQTLLEVRSPFSTSLSSLSGLTISWIGDSNNILNEMIVTYPRLGINLQIATPKGYELDPEVMERARLGLEKEGGTGKIFHTHSPEEAVQGADVVTTDTWSVPSLFLPSTTSLTPSQDLNGTRRGDGEASRRFRRVPDHERHAQARRSQSRLHLHALSPSPLVRSRRRDLPWSFVGRLPGG